MSIVKYRPDIDGLRALAVLSVLVFHVDPSLLPGGFLGVDIFFVISGYLISLILFREQAEGSFSFAGFYGRRVRRLFPALVLVLGASLLFGFFALFANEYERLGQHAAAAIVFVLNFQLLGEAGYFDAVSYSKPLLHLWSLSVEEQFYLLWPVLLLASRRFRCNPGWVIAACAALSLFYGFHLGRISPDKLYYHSIPRFWELLSGVAIAWMHQKNGTSWLPSKLNQARARDALSLAGLVLTASALLAFNKALRHPGWATLWPIMGVVMLMASGPAALVNRALSWRPLVWIGLISYPLYLWHWPILSYARIAESGSPAPWMLWLGAALAMVLAWATYVGVELPLRRMVGSDKGKHRVTVFLCCAMGALLTAAAAVVLSKGMPERSALQYFKKNEGQMIREARQDASCLALFAGKAAPVYCRQSNAGERMIALIGDSHAHVLFSGVSELAAQQGYGTLLLANSGCPPFVGAVTGRTPAEHEQCAESIETIVEALRRDKRIVSVVMASRGPQYLNGLGFGPVEANYNYPPIAARSSPAGGASVSPEQAFTGGLMTTAAQLHERGMRVSYLLQVPELGVSARDCLGRPLTLSRRAVDGCTVPYDIYQRRMQPYRAQIAGLAAKAPYLHIIDVEPALCGAGGCSGLIDGQLMYADDNHLSVAGSRRVAPLIVKVALPAGGH
jgi:peptidoglycan/LPS O-acetylase OafA/YrhL